MVEKYAIIFQIIPCGSDPRHFLINATSHDKRKPLVINGLSFVVRTDFILKEEQTNSKKFVVISRKQEYRSINTPALLFFNDFEKILIDDIDVTKEFEEMHL